MVLFFVSQGSIFFLFVCTDIPFFFFACIWYAFLVFIFIIALDLISDRYLLLFGIFACFDSMCNENILCQKLGEIENNKEKDVDYLSSIEVLFPCYCVASFVLYLSLYEDYGSYEQVLIIDHADIIAMQVFCFSTKLETLYIGFMLLGNLELSLMILELVPCEYCYWTHEQDTVEAAWNWCDADKAVVCSRLSLFRYIFPCLRENYTPVNDIFIC